MNPSSERFAHNNPNDDLSKPNLPKKGDDFDIGNWLRALKASSQNEELYVAANQDVLGWDPAKYSPQDRQAVIRQIEEVKQSNEPSNSDSRNSEHLAEIINTATQNFDQALNGHSPLFDAWHFTRTTHDLSKLGKPWAKQIYDDFAKAANLPTKGDQALYQIVSENDSLTSSRILQTAWSQLLDDQPIEVAYYLAKRAEFLENHQKE